MSISRYDGIHSKPLPPGTRRFCVACNKVTVWHFNRRRFHSDCSECGGWICNPAYKEEIMGLEKTLEKKKKIKKRTYNNILKNRRNTRKQKIENEIREIEKRLRCAEK
jgi:hypothetical protein